MKSKKVGCLIAFLVLSAFVMVVLIAVYQGGEGVKETKRVKETERVEIEHSLGYKLCVIDGGYESEDSTEVRRYNYLLETLSKKCSCTKEEIADMATAAKFRLRDHYGRDIKALGLLETTNENLPYGGRKEDCARTLTLIMQVLK